ncbi:hypothetical protein AB0L53_58625 [Nonomuraea sp. NPDC052129]|uniref:hypothetical protein n=1 Tax=Nonomuraea sp. NPDC052129 TaxID=3154651 RepID=UPI00342925F1
MEAVDNWYLLKQAVSPANFFGQLRGAIRKAVPDTAVLSDIQIAKIAHAVVQQAENAARLERLRQRRREWTLLIIGAVIGGLLSIPIGIWVNSIS